MQSVKINMFILTFLTFVVAIAIMVGMDIFLFSEDVLYGIGGVIGILSFFKDHLQNPLFIIDVLKIAVLVSSLSTIAT